MSSFLVACSVCSVILVCAGSAIAARSHAPSPKANTAECSAMLKQAYECKVEIRRLSRARASAAGGGQSGDLALREAQCEQWQERYVAVCRR